MSSLLESVAEPEDQIAADLNIRFFPRQTFAYRSPATEQLFGGAKGGGKSGYIRMSFIMWCMRAAGLQCALFRRHWNELYGNHMEGPHSFPDILAGMKNKGLCSITAHHVRFWNGSHIQLGHLQLPKDVYKYTGIPIHVAGFDEATQLEESQYRFLAYTVVRLGNWKPPEDLNIFPKVISGANPGGPSHKFFKKGFVDQNPYQIYRADIDQGGMFRQFIPARAEDNPALMRNDPTYLDRLEGGGDPILVRALKEGDWRIVAGSMYGEVWRETLHGRPWHVHPGFPIPETWPLWRGGDDGYENPSVIYWMTEDPEYGTLYVVDELWMRHALPSKLGERILEKDMQIALKTVGGNTRYNREQLRGSYDSSAFVSTGLEDSKGAKSITRGDQMNRLGCKWTPVEKWPGSRAARAQNLHRLLQPNPKAPPGPRFWDGDRIKTLLGPDGEPLMAHDRPGIVFFQRCTHAIDTIPQLARSENNPEEVDDPNDHCFDGVTYTVQHRKGKARMIGLSGI